MTAVVTTTAARAAASVSNCPCARSGQVRRRGGAGSSSRSPTRQAHRRRRAARRHGRRSPSQRYRRWARPLFHDRIRTSEGACPRWPGLCRARQRCCPADGRDRGPGFARGIAGFFGRYGVRIRPLAALSQHWARDLGRSVTASCIRFEQTRHRRLAPCPRNRAPHGKSRSAQPSGPRQLAVADRLLADGNGVPADRTISNPLSRSQEHSHRRRGAAARHGQSYARLPAGGGEARLDPQRLRPHRCRTIIHRAIPSRPGKTSRRRVN